MSLTEKRLAQIRWKVQNRAENNIIDEDTADLLAEVDRLRADIETLPIEIGQHTSGQHPCVDIKHLAVLSNPSVHRPRR